jgi:hypothetical protein
MSVAADGIEHVVEHIALNWREVATMTDTDSGWDIPGIDRRAAPPTAR